MVRGRESIHIGKEVHLSSFLDNAIVSVENLKKSIKRLLE